MSVWMLWGRCQDELEHARDLLGEMSMEEKGGGGRRWQGGPSDHHASLTPMKSKTEGRIR